MYHTFKSAFCESIPKPRFTASKAASRLPRFCNAKPARKYPLTNDLSVIIHCLPSSAASCHLFNAAKHAERLE